MSSKQDLNGVRTAQDLERKYDLKSIVGVKKAVEKNEISLTKMNNELENFIVETVEDISNLQSQIDGNITTYFYSGEPTLENLPASEWTTEEEKANHLGDLYYDNVTGYAYRFILNSETNTYNWIQLSDSATTEALAIANAAQDTADSKRRVFVSQPTIPYDIGDIWIRDDQDIYRCARTRVSGEFYAGDFVLATKYTDDRVANEALALANATKITLETNYVTNTTLETTKDSINGSISKLAITVDSKNTVYTSKPKPPYIVGDVYALNDKIYVCNTNRQAGEEYDESDWDLNIDTAKLVKETTFNATTDLIKGQVKELEDESKLHENRISTLEISVDGIRQIVEDVPSITTIAEGTGVLHAINVFAYDPVELKIHPTIDDYKVAFPCIEIFPSVMLYPYDSNYGYSRTIVFESEEKTVEYTIPTNLYYIENEYGPLYDEFYFSNTDKQCYVIHRIGIDENGKKYALEEQRIEYLTYPDLMLDNGDYSIYVRNFEDTYVYTKLLLENDYTKEFVTEVKLNSAITQTAEAINLEVSKKVGNDEVISKINQSAEAITINANKLNLQGYITATDLSGNGTTTINGSNIKTGTISANRVSGGTLSGTTISGNTITGGTISGTTISGGTISGNTINGTTINGANITTNTDSYTNGIEVYSNNGGTGINIKGATLTTHDSGGNNTLSLNYQSGWLKTNTLQAGTVYSNSGNGSLNLVANGSASGGDNAVWISAAGNVTLNPNGAAYVRIGDGSSYKISTAGGQISSKILKKNIKEFNENEYEDSINLLRKIKIYNYDYKYKVKDDNEDNKNNYGFIIDEVEEVDNKFFKFKETKAIVTENNNLDELGANENPEDKNIISYKRYDEENLVKYLLTVCKEQQNQIDKLQERIEALENEKNN